MHGLTRATLISNKVHFLGAVAGSCCRTHAHDDIARPAPGGKCLLSGIGGRGRGFAQLTVAGRDNGDADGGGAQLTAVGRDGGGVDEDGDHSLSPCSSRPAMEGCPHCHLFHHSNFHTTQAAQCHLFPIDVRSLPAMMRRVVYLEGNDIGSVENTQCGDDIQCL